MLVEIRIKKVLTSDERFIVEVYYARPETVNEHYSRKRYQVSRDSNGYHYAYFEYSVDADDRRGAGFKTLNDAVDDILEKNNWGWEVTDQQEDATAAPPTIRSEGV